MTQPRGGGRAGWGARALAGGFAALVVATGVLPSAGLAAGPETDERSGRIGCEDVRSGRAAANRCEDRPSSTSASEAKPAAAPAATPAAAPAARTVSVIDAKWAAANAYDRFLKGTGSAEEFKAAEEVLAKVSRERIGTHDWSIPDNTPAGLRLRGITPPHDYGPLVDKFWPFEQITWWYCGPATAQSILWYLGPHRSESYDEVWGGRPWLKGQPYDDQWILANSFWLGTNDYEGTNWGERYMPFTLNAWRGTFWYQQSAAPGAGGSLTKEQALIAMRYDFDRSYPVAENVTYASHTYYPYGFWPGITYQHWDVVHGYVEDLATGEGYVRIGQVYHDERVPYERFQQVAWDVHWGAIANWHGIVW